MEHLLKYRRVLILFCHMALISASVLAAFLLRFEFSIPKNELKGLELAVWTALAAKVIAFWLARLDRGWWRLAGISELRQIIGANLLGSAFFLAAGLLVAGRQIPLSIYCIDLPICLMAVSGLRLSVRIYYETVAREASRTGRKGVLLYGAGAAAVTLLREIRSNAALGYHVVGFLDDDKRKLGTLLMGSRVLGGGRDAARIVERNRSRRHPVQEIIIAMPSASGRQMQEALANCRAAGVPCKTVPGVGELLSGKVLTSQIRDVSVVDLLGREPVRLDESVIRSSIASKVVLVTGAGGSIGSELCRQVALYQPRRLVAVDQGETDLFRIEMELRERHPALDVSAQIGDIRDYGRMEEIIRTQGTNSVFHAAAYKHVPMMEAHLLEAVRNNVIGTRNLVAAAVRNRVESFLMISSDKAVNPTNIMGLTKRVAELIVCSMPAPASGETTKFVAVRFGNVLASNGSVIPLFKRQIEAGGPVTVTHPEMRRYFMTIPEAVQLVLQASTMGQGSEIFVLDMGEPVRIIDLARNMIRLSGREPGTDIEIRFVGMRPGEKLFEELITAGEDTMPTYHEKIKIFRGPAPARAAVERWLRNLEAAVSERDETQVLSYLMELVPEYQPGGRWQESIRRPAQHAETAH